MDKFQLRGPWKTFQFFIATQEALFLVSLTQEYGCIHLAGH